MSKRIETAREKLRNLGWELLSDEYQNKTTPITVRCANCGQVVFTSLEEVQKGGKCIGCESTQREDNLRVAEIVETQLPQKKGRRLLALDQSTTNCGWSVFEDGKLLQFGVKKLDKSDINFRIAEVDRWFREVLKLWEIDEVGFEDIQLQRDPLTYKKLAMLLGVLVNSTIAELGTEPRIVGSNVWCSACGIHARYRDERKRQSQNRVLKLFGQRVSQDAADAINIGTFFAQKSK